MIFNLTKVVLYNYNYLKKKYEELYDIIKNFQSLNPDINFDKILQQIQNNVNNINNLINSVDEINKNLNTTNKKIKNLENLNNENKNNIDNINKKLEENETNNENIKNQIKENNESINKINNDINKINSNYDEYLKYKESLDNEIKNLNQVYDSYISDKKLLEENLNKRFEEIYKKIDEIKNDYNDESLKELINNNTKAIEDLKNKNDNNIKRLDSLDNKITSIISRLDVIETSINTINSEIKKIQNNINDINDNINNLTNNIETLKTNLENYKNSNKQDLDNINKNITDINKNINNLESNINNLNNTIKTVQSDINNIKSDIINIHNDIDILKTNDFTKNIIELVNVVSVYNYNNFVDQIFKDPVNDISEILRNINFTRKKNIDIIILNNINYSIDSEFFFEYNNKTNEFFYVIKNNKIYNNDKEGLCDFFYIKNNNIKHRNISNLYSSNNLVRIVVFEMEYKSEKNTISINYFFLNLYKYEETPIESYINIIKETLIKKYNNEIKINNFFIINDISKEEKEKIYNGLYPNSLTESANKGTSTFINNINNNIYYFGDFNVLTNNLIFNDFTKKAQISTMVLIPNYLSDIIYLILN